MNSEKISVAFKSVIAAVFLTILKLIVGIATGSLGIISEAIHSGLDLVAAFITLLAVRISDKPADERHTFGHGKVENFSALIETILLLITCIWIIYEAIYRLITKNYIVEVTIYSFIVIIICIIVNISRYISLNNAAKKYNSQALEADALHFISDVYSSLIVIVGLILTYFGYGFADPVAAIGVSIMILFAVFNLGRDTVEALLDTAPSGIIEKIKKQVESTEGVITCEKVRVRPSGASLFINISVGLSKYENHNNVYNVIHKIKQKLTADYPNSDISICTFPVEENNFYNEYSIFNEIKDICCNINGIKNCHNIKIFSIGGKKHISLHVETDENIGLDEAHKLVHKVEEKIINKLENVSDVSIYLQHSQSSRIDVEDVTNDNYNLVESIKNIVNNTINNCSCSNIKIYKQGKKCSVFLSCKLDPSTKLNRIQNISFEISNNLKKSFDIIDDVYIHFEPK